MAYSESACAFRAPKNTRVVNDPEGATPRAAPDVAHAGRTPGTLTSPEAEEGEAAELAEVAAESVKADRAKPAESPDTAEAPEDDRSGAADAAPDPSASVATRQVPVVAAISTDIERLEEKVECGE